MNILFNNYKLPGVISCQFKRVTRNTNVAFNAAGDMLMDMVNRKMSLTVYLGGLRASELQNLFAATENSFFTVTYENPITGHTSALFHMREQAAQTDYTHEGITYYKALKLVLEER